MVDEMEQQDTSAGAGEAGGQAAPPSEDDKTSRVDAAKAFFRAMYAGEEPAKPFGGGGNAEQSAPSGPCKNCQGLEQMLKESEQKMQEIDNLYKRMAADFENYRRRMEREREDAVGMGVKKAAEALLPALDDLDRALAYLTPETPHEKVIESFHLVANRVHACMEGIGIKKLEAVGAPFDPKFHEPVQQVETTEHADGAVMQELRKGYMLNDKVIRPALVNVAYNPNGTAAPATQQAAEEETFAQDIPPVTADADAKSEEGTSAASGSGDTEEALTVYDLGDDVS